MSAPKLIASLVTALTLLTGLAATAIADTRRLEGRLPENTPVVSIDQTRGTVLDALSAIAKQAGWSLVVTAPESVTIRPLAIQASKRPASDVLELVLEAGSLRATFANGVLRVRSDTTAVAGDSVRERRRERRGRRGAERVVFGQSLTVGPDEVVDKAVAVGGSVTVAGHVRRDAVAVGGSVTLQPGARVEGDAVAVGGVVSVEEGASLEGDNVSLGGTIPTMAGALTRWAVDRPHLRSMFGFASRLTRTVLLFVVALLIALAFPGHVTRVRAFLVGRPGLSTLGGMVLLVGFLPLCALLAVTIIGIPLIPVAVMLLVALLLFGFTVSAGWLGEKMPLLQENKTPFKAVALGGVVLVIVGLVPWIGTLAIVLAASVSAGATLLSRFGRRVEVPA
ncbi:MAG: hypothetical protein DMD96_14105 [Candidatus Rokuibacteriota bacterium]|nr:MAG: hypothetical protein DMD96_14105 [Candidatus Rokubacteria bacterium]